MNDPSFPTMYSAPYENNDMFHIVHIYPEAANSDAWCMDDNFTMAPSIFMQLYVIQGRVSAVCVPLVYVLLQRKTQTCYESMFGVLKEHGCDPSVVIIDCGLLM
jgi:hypothetical protein